MFNDSVISPLIVQASHSEWSATLRWRFFVDCDRPTSKWSTASCEGGVPADVKRQDSLCLCDVVILLCGDISILHMMNCCSLFQASKDKVA